jgi:hypothetical protein
VLKLSWNLFEVPFRKQAGYACVDGKDVAIEVCAELSLSEVAKKDVSTTVLGMV